MQGEERWFAKTAEGDSKRPICARLNHLSHICLQEVSLQGHILVSMSGPTGCIVPYAQTVKALLSQIN